ncbi:phosphodiesterase [Boudabousia liubingyangii]|uniref:Phosphodiesterase n=1 Tax=Boudabousia liubingyangii TaxID=1921764 RepID=A0A1Q5PPX1_9ACTO|nr:sulfatase-like hydrolase/transferase [Boudabousia liubingyangii]OKL48412.1 phosphodiesterase [Boudabousia liubingyangii]OKL49562.1 phosphodiesterase [Boudabousia liubingyangii]
MTENTQTRPNFLVILTDDQGPWAMSRTMPELVTPTVDSLVANGTTFDNFYCASPVCSPARASLLTGRMPSAHGVHDWLVGERHPDAAEDVYLGGLANLPETLQRAGYTCGMSGKWHVGTAQRPAPGFDFWYAHRLGGGPYYGAPVWSEDGTRVSEERYFTYAVAEEACKFIDQMGQAKRAADTGAGRFQAGTNDPSQAPGSDPENPKDNPNPAPFYLQVNFTAPHDPWINNHPQDLYDLYDGCEFESVPREDPHPWTKQFKKDFEDAFANPTPYLQGYAASLSGVDRALKDLLDRLKANGLDENTVVVYMADNGFSCGHHGIWGKGNGTFPMNFWENSVRVPFVISLPGQSQARTVADHVSATSFFPTICELAGVEPQEDPLRAGDSVAGLVKGERPGDGTDSVVIYDEYGSGRMIRNGDWKFIDRYDGPIELYNLANDPEERENLADTSDHKGIQADLKTELHDWFKAHETAQESAWGRTIIGRGQVHPPRRGYDDERTYVTTNVCIDGNRDDA